jgi:hypothetical protein
LELAVHTVEEEEVCFALIKLTYTDTLAGKIYSRALTDFLFLGWNAVLLIVL